LISVKNRKFETNIMVLKFLYAILKLLVLHLLLLCNSAAKHLNNPVVKR